jgi:hypothetical protein
MSAQRAAELVLMAGVIPLWILSGVADWWCHRRTAIERTSGLAENAFHWVLLAEGGVALVAVALLEIDAALLLLVAAAFLAHEITTYVELRYTVPRREVRPIEQMVHSFMEILPLAMLGLLAVIAWEQVAAVVGGGAANLGLRLKENPWPVPYLLGVAAAVLMLNVIPMAEEGVRCWRARA